MIWKCLIFQLSWSCVYDPVNGSWEDGMETSNVRSIVPWKMECESKNGVIFDILFHLLAEMIRDLKMWCKVESPCYQGSGSCAPGIILVNFAGADEQ